MNKEEIRLEINQLKEQKRVLEREVKHLERETENFQQKVSDIEDEADKLADKIEDLIDLIDDVDYKIEDLEDKYKEVITPRQPIDNSPDIKKSAVNGLKLIVAIIGLIYILTNIANAQSIERILLEITAYIIFLKVL